VSRFPVNQIDWEARTKEFGPLRVIAHTAVQFDIFIHAHRIPRPFARHIRSFDEMRAVLPKQPLIRLPGWDSSRDYKLLVELNQIVAYWAAYGGSFKDLTEEQSRGSAPLCLNDTDGDGDCHICAGRGGCPWPNREVTP
jgi:hypothetical protein